MNCEFLPNFLSKLIGNIDKNVFKTIQHVALLIRHLFFGKMN